MRGSPHHDARRRFASGLEPAPDAASSPEIVGALPLDALSVGHYARWRDILVLMLFSILGHSGCRQLPVMWRLQGFRALMRDTTGWGVMERKGLGARPT